MNTRPPDRTVPGPTVQEQEAPVGPAASEQAQRSTEFQEELRKEATPGSGGSDVVPPDEENGPAESPLSPMV